MSADFGSADDYGEPSRGRPWASSRGSTLRTPGFSPFTDHGSYPEHSFAPPETPSTPAARTRLAMDDVLGGADTDAASVLSSALRQEDGALRLLAAYRAHAANLEARLAATSAAHPSSTLVRLMEDEERLRGSALRLLEQDAPSRIRSPAARREVADMAAAQKKEAQLLRGALTSASMGGPSVGLPYETMKEREASGREKDREIEHLRQENTRLRTALREETLSLQTRLRELGRAGALLASAHQQPVSADSELQQILETDLWSAVNARLQSVIDRRLREEQMRSADLLVEQRQLKAENERIRRDLDAATVLIRKLQTEDLKDYAQLREQREVDRRTIEELRAARDGMAVEHDKVAEVCRGLQQLLDSTTALLKRTASEVDGAGQRAEEAIAMRTKAEEAYATAVRELEALKSALAASEAALRDASERLREAEERQRALESALKEVPVLRASLAAAEAARRDTEERAAAELAAGAHRLAEERQRAAVEARALQAKVAFLSKAESAIKESISEVRNTCNVLHTLLSRPDAAISAQ